MRLIDYYNIFALSLFIILTAWLCYSVKNKYRATGINTDRMLKTVLCSQKKTHRQEICGKLTSYDYAAIFILLIGCILRLYRLAEFPRGFNQDEASIGYDGWSILTYGIDRNGFHNPIYPITWGSGGGSPLMVYIVGISQKVLGSSVFSVRLPIAIAGCLTIILFTVFVRRYFGDKSGLVAAFCITLNPWQLMQSRWTLDCNMTPFFILVSIAIFMAGVSYQKTICYAASAAVFALCLYTYGSTTIVIPCYLIIICSIAKKRGVLTTRQFVIGVIIFIIVVLPLAVFYAINFLELPEIITPWFSINRFVSKRGVFYPFDRELPARILKNMVYVINVCTIGYFEPYNELRQTYLPSFGTMYRFTFPVTLMGGALCIRRSLKNMKMGKTIIPEELFIIHFIVSALFALFVEPGISRSTLLFLNVIFFQYVGLEKMTEYVFFSVKQDYLENESSLKNSIRHILYSIPLALLAGLIWVGGAALFVRDYFGQEARVFQTYGFMPLYGEAVSYAESVRKADQNIVSTKHSLVDPYMLALFFSHTSPYDFIRTAEYIGDDSEFRETNHFTHYTFVLPSYQSIDIKNTVSSNDILIVHSEECGHFSENDYTYKQFDDYYVLVPRQ